MEILWGKWSNMREKWKLTRVHPYSAWNSFGVSISSEIASPLSVIQTHFDDVQRQRAHDNLILCSRSFRFVSTVQKQFDSAVESIISTGENDSDFASKYKQPVDLKVERLASTSDLHFDSIVASLSFNGKRTIWLEGRTIYLKGHRFWLNGQIYCFNGPRIM